MREIVRAGAWSGFRELVTELGGDAEAILATARIASSMLTEPDRYLSLRAFLECQEIAARELGRPDFGLMLGSRQNLAMLGPLSIAILNAATARESIEICARYLHVHNPSARVLLTPRPRSPFELLSSPLTLSREMPRSQNSERAVASFHVMLGQVVGPDYQPREVWFTHKPLSPPSVYRKHFGVAPLFGKPSNGIALDRKLLDVWRPSRSPQLKRIAETYLRSIAPPRATTWSVRAASVMRSLLRGGDCSPEQTAKTMSVHPRTLQRRLKAEGASFEAIRDSVRREMAEALLAQPGLSLSQIAQMLHYADSSAFSKCARRWFGESPSAHRRRAAAHPLASRRRAASASGH